VRRSALATAALLVALAPSRAEAHKVGLSNGDYRLVGSTFLADLGLAERELAAAAPALDPDHDGVLSNDELAAGKALLARVVVDGLRVEGDGAPCPGALDAAWDIDGENGIVVRARYACPREPSHLSITWPLLTSGQLSPDHRHVAHFAFRGKNETTVLDAAHATWTLGATAAGLFRAMVVLGVEHILSGWDHLLFLFGLILVGGRPRALVGVVTAFTVAHSLTLALAALGVWAPSPRVVEPLIALSIAYVGVENFFVTDASRRWRVTFPFGLVHGFGFAGALREIALPRGQIPAALVSFNLGVERGPRGVPATPRPLAPAARRAPRFGERGVRVVSAAIAIAGVVLFVARLAA
jgi:hypothetical protein